MMMMMANTWKNKEESKSPGLVDLVFSWSIADVMNRNLFSHKVKQIPETFISTDHYLKSFIYPLLEETRADLFSNVTTLARAPVCEVFDVRKSQNFKPPKGLCYSILLKSASENDRKEGTYEPESGDLIALTDVRPKRIDDLNTSKWPYVLALIQGPKKEDTLELSILSSKLIEFVREGKEKGKNGDKLFAVYLTNLTTNMRIWKALNPVPEVANVKIIRSALQVDPSIGWTCSACSDKAKGAPDLNQIAAIRNFGLDKSQESAILNCIATKDCHHQNMVQLIWGPPGTGKTKTVASLLFVLLQTKCRTLTCAPTNVAVIGVINRLMTLLMPTLEYDTYGLGDIILFGNKERMKIDDYEDLFDVFLDHRVRALQYCVAPLTGWKGSSESMIQLLEDPEKEYQLYSNKEKEMNKNDDDKKEGDEEVELEEGLLMERNARASRGKQDDVENQGLKSSKQKFGKKVIVGTLKENKKKQTTGKSDSQKKMYNQGTDHADSKKGRSEESNGVENPITFEEFFMKKFTSIASRLIICITSWYTHMPTSFIPVEVAEDMIRVVDMLQALGTLIPKVVANGGLREVLYGIKTAGGEKGNLKELLVTRNECLLKLKIIQEKICHPNVFKNHSIDSFCLKFASLIFCTASSSSKLHRETKAPIELLIIDEAAQLKECESAIPLQLAGLRHAILIGDQKQLPAMVQSEMSEKAGFGRSLFERLATLGHPKNLLNVQYRMHPSISLFPNREFYGKQIKDGPNVRDASYKKSFLEGHIYGSYSFIDINHGFELFDDRHSRKNLVEVYVVAAIIANLHKQFLVTKQKVRVGCISPYKAQVFELQEKLGNAYSTDVNSDFSVNVRSVDGFQGGEEDVVILSTVRCNGNGSIGFLSNHQRTNVALTRARHCLWILGNSATLINSDSVWKRLVLDAKSRRCFYNAGDDKNLSKAISTALIDGGLYKKLIQSHSGLFKNARWKVCFRDDFSKSFARIQDSDIRFEVLSILVKLSRGWRQPQKSNTTLNLKYGASALVFEMYDLKGQLKLIWTIDIQRDNSRDIQVIKVWDILPGSEIPMLASNPDKLFGNYSANNISRCKLRKMEGELVVPVSWPLEANSVTGNLGTDAEPTESLVAKLAEQEAKGSEERIAMYAGERLRMGTRGGPQEFDALPFSQILELEAKGVTPPHIENSKQKEKIIFLVKPTASLSGPKRKVNSPAAECGNIEGKEEWSCAICQVNTNSERALKDHLQGKRHKSKEATLRAERKVKSTGEECRNTEGKEEWSCAICQVNTNCEHALKDHFQGKRHKSKEAALRAERKVKSPAEECRNTEGKEEWSCAICPVNTNSERAIKDHFQGKRHKSKEASLRVERNVKSPREECRNTEGKEEWSCAICPVNTNSQRALKDHFLGKRHKSKEATLRAERKVKSPGEECRNTEGKEEWRCAICQVNTNSERALKDHFHGKRHKSKEAALRAERKVKSPAEECRNTEGKEEWSCAICQVNTNSERALKDHFQGKRHKSKEGVLSAERNGCNIGLRAERKVKSPAEECRNTKGKEEWSCAICQVNTNSERALKDHFQGKRHKSKEAVLSAERNGCNIGLGVSPNNTVKPAKEETHVLSSQLVEGEALQINQNALNSPQRLKLEGVALLINQSEPSALHTVSTECLDESNMSKMQENEKKDKLKNEKLVAVQKAPKSKLHEKENFTFWCDMYQVGTYSEIVMEGHRKGKKHLKLLEDARGDGVTNLTSQIVDIHGANVSDETLKGDKKAFENVNETSPKDDVKNNDVKENGRSKMTRLLKGLLALWTSE